jgi:hypothetical protein
MDYLDSLEMPRNKRCAFSFVMHGLDPCIQGGRPTG